MTIALPRRVALQALNKLRRAHGAWRNRVAFARACDHPALLRRAVREVRQLARLISNLEEVCRGR
jgi:hypothetical protein